MQVMLEHLTELGYATSIDVPNYAFDELERND